MAAEHQRSTGDDNVQAQTGTFVDRYVHVVRLKRFVNVRTFADYDAAQLNVMHLVGPDATAAQLFFQMGGRMVETVTYRPGGPQFITEGDFEALNLYRPTTLQPTRGDAGPWLELVRHIVPDAEPRRHVLDHFSSQVQRPGIKVNHAIVLGGGQGIGKDSLLKPLIEALGPHNVGIVTPLELDSAFNDFVLNKSLLLVQEIAAFSNRGLANRLKPLLAEPPHVLHINRKFVPAFDVPNIVNIVMMTNSATPLAIEPDDRRFFFYHSTAAPKDASYYRDYHAWVAGHAGEVLGFLLDRDISAFDPKARPPMTSAKQALIEDSRPLLRQHLSAIAESLPDLVTINSIIELLPTTLRSTSPRALGRELRELGARELRKVRLLNGDRRCVWAMRRASLYVSMSDQKLAENFAAMRTVSLRPGAAVVDLDTGQS